jgi:N-acetylglucosaminyldiphosphoundecaprenol N-acetyl-beta-D-mannosaminyltransferase
MDPSLGPNGTVVTVAGLPILDVSFQQTVDLILQWATDGSGGYVCTPNADYVVRAQRDAAFREAICGARIRVPDGMWIVYAARLAGLSLGGTVTGRLLLPAVAKRARAQDLSIALFGAAPGVAEQAAATLRGRFPDLDVRATISPPMGIRIGSAEDLAGVNVLREAAPSIIFVGLGAPKQEIWMQQHSADFPGTVMVGVGQAFDVVAGHRREAPGWATRLGFEWVFRLVQEPRRLGRRYLVDDPWIIGWAIQQRIRRIGPRIAQLGSLFRPRSS